MTTKKKETKKKGMLIDAEIASEKEIDDFNESQNEKSSEFEPESDWIPIEDNAPFHDFDEVPIYIGIFDKSVTFAEGTEKEFDALRFVNSDGEASMIKNNYTIARAIEKAETDFPDQVKLYRIEFLGKTVIKGKPFNQYRVDISLMS